MIGIIAICIDIAILIAIGSNPGYSAEARWACVALVALFSLCSGQLNPDTQLSRFSASAGGIPSLC
ncbi:hypothetical protein ACK316_08855, partial [Aeromonas caviae]